MKLLIQLTKIQNFDYPKVILFKIGQVTYVSSSSTSGLATSSEVGLYKSFIWSCFLRPNDSRGLTQLNVHLDRKEAVSSGFGLSSKSVSFIVMRCLVTFLLWISFFVEYEIWIAEFWGYVGIKKKDCVFIVYLFVVWSMENFQHASSTAKKMNEYF